jgi:hypothetical protein
VMQHCNLLEVLRISHRTYCISSVGCSTYCSWSDQPVDTFFFSIQCSITDWERSFVASKDDNLPLLAKYYLKYVQEDAIHPETLVDCHHDRGKGARASFRVNLLLASEWTLGLKECDFEKTESGNGRKS